MWIMTDFFLTFNRIFKNKKKIDHELPNSYVSFLYDSSCDSFCFSLRSSYFPWSFHTNNFKFGKFFKMILARESLLQNSESTPIFFCKARKYLKKLSSTPVRWNDKKSQIQSIICFFLYAYFFRCSGVFTRCDFIGWRIFAHNKMGGRIAIHSKCTPSIHSNTFHSCI